MVLVVSLVLERAWLASSIPTEGLVFLLLFWHMAFLVLIISSSKAQNSLLHLHIVCHNRENPV